MSVIEYLRRLDEINNNSLNLHQFIKDFQKFEKTFIETCKTFHDEKYDKIYTLDGLCESSLSRIEARQVKINNIREILNKCEISVTFVGGVSCGKSKIINSVLEEEVLPSSIGVTTTKIVKLIGSNEGKYYIKHPDRQFKDKESLYEEVMNVSTDELDEKGGESLIEVVISNPNKPILNDKTFLIDTPGYNANDRAKELVMETCQRSDVIVFVMTYVFSDEEKEMFKLISQKTSKLNLFILVNKWDESDSDESFTVEMSKNSIERRLVDWFQANNDTDKSRIFFISAMEQMDSFVKPDKEANEFRRKEFQRFIEGLELSLSDPKFCKCLKHEQDIIAMETDLKTDFDNTTKALSEIINSRTKTIGYLKITLDLIKDQEQMIKNMLQDEQERKVSEIKDSQKSFLLGLWDSGIKKVSNFVFKTDKKSEVDILNFDAIVDKFDMIINHLQEEVAAKFEKIVILLQAKEFPFENDFKEFDLYDVINVSEPLATSGSNEEESSSSDIDKSSSEKPKRLKKNELKNKVPTKMSKPSSSEKPKRLEKNINNDPSAMESHVLHLFADFNKTIETTFQLMHSKVNNLLKATEDATKGLIEAQEKMPPLPINSAIID